MDTPDGGAGAPVAVWLRTIASAKGPDHAQVRAVLHAMATFMNGQAVTWVSLEALAVCTALHPRRVRLLVRRAEKAGWLSSAIERQGRGRQWRLKTYRGSYPAGVTPAGREDRMSPRQRNVRIRQQGREDQASTDVRTREPSKSPIEVSKEYLRGSAPAPEARAPLKPSSQLPTHLAARLQKRKAVLGREDTQSSRSST